MQQCHAILFTEILKNVSHLHVFPLKLKHSLVFGLKDHQKTRWWSARDVFKLCDLGSKCWPPPIAIFVQHLKYHECSRANHTRCLIWEMVQRILSCKKDEQQFSRQLKVHISIYIISAVIDSLSWRWLLERKLFYAQPTTVGQLFSVEGTDLLNLYAP